MPADDPLYKTLDRQADIVTIEGLLHLNKIYYYMFITIHEGRIIRK